MRFLLDIQRSIGHFDGGVQLHILLILSGPLLLQQTVHQKQRGDACTRMGVGQLIDRL